VSNDVFVLCWRCSLTLRLVPALPLLFLMACPGEPEQEPPDDSSPGDSSPGDSGEPQDTGAETGLDTGEPSDWISLPASCEAPGDLGPSAFTEVGEVVLSGVDGMETVYFAEMVDLEVDEENAVAWGVGQGGLVAFGLQEPSQPEFVGYYHAPVGRLYRVELGVDGFIYATHRDSGLFSTTAPTRATSSGSARSGHPTWRAWPGWMIACTW